MPEKSNIAKVAADRETLRKLDLQDSAEPVETVSASTRHDNRHKWLADRRALPDGSRIKTIARGSRQRRAMENAASPPAAPHLVELRALVAPPAVAPYWTPLGPSAVANGQADGHPTVSGRVTSIAAGPGGTRVYIGTANGGTWYSEDSGASWAPIDEYALPGQPARLSHMEADSLSTGAIAVRFGANAAADIIFVGTGEPQSSADSPVDSAPNDGDSYYGVGIKSSPSGGTGAVWTLEATNLAGHGVFRIVIDPENPAVVFAATSTGLFMRPQPPLPAAAGSYTVWTPITAGLPANTSVSDLIVAGRGAGRVYFASLWGGQVFRSTDAFSTPGGGTWTACAGIGAHGNSRVVLASSDVPALGGTPPIVYALLADSTLYRLDVAATGNFSQVTGIPKALFFGGQGYYDIALAVDPNNPSTVYMCGDTVYHDDWNLSIFKGTITGAAGSYVFPFNAANDMVVDAQGNKDSTHVANDATYIGQGIHADGHAIAFATNADGTHDPTNVWVGCDGGIFQSTQSGTRGSFKPRNTGLAITQITYTAHHPATDTVLFAGAQDQGSVRFRGDSVCFEDPEGDGGGIAYDPINGYRVMQQYNKTSLSISSDGGASGNWTDLSAAGKFPPVGSSPSVAQKASLATESSNTSFYAPIAAIAVDATHSLAAFGTNRLWITSDWGQTWVTIPSNSNPYAAGGTSTVSDQLDGQAVTAILWASPTQIYVATRNNVFRFDQAGGNWTPNPPTALPTTNLPAARFITSIDVENATTGSLYITLAGGNVDHVWYFDPAANTWTSAGLTQAILDVPCHSIVVDPLHTEQVYLGTDVGVFKGVKTGAAWAWNLFPAADSNLPECAVPFLALHPVTRILRAATHGLGVWEIPIDGVNLPDPDLYLRANAADSGRAPRPAWLDGVADPTKQGTTLTRSSSPDIKVLRSSHSQSSSTPDFVGFAGLKGFQPDLNTFDTLGQNQIFIEVHNRGKTAVAGDQVRVLLMLADGSGALPALPADFATRFQNGDTTAWLPDGWKFADPTTPYRALPKPLDARLPQIVQYNVDFSSLNFAPDKVAAAAFVTTDTDPFTSVLTDANALILADKRVAVRTLEKGTDWRVVLGIVLVLVGVAAVAVAAEELS
jgi:hypothetical protein